ncbi:MAG: hypothetical protein ACJAWW_002714, partial [Sulfurimonas sp.]
MKRRTDNTYIDTLGIRCEFSCINNRDSLLNKLWNVPYKLSDKQNGFINILYDLSTTAKELYQDIYKNILEMIFIIIAIYPTILFLHKDLLLKTYELSQTNIEILKLLGSAIAKHDSDTDTHNYRVTLYSL